MKYLLMAIAGVLVGAAVGTVLLVFNPLTATGEARLAGFDRMLQYVLPADALVVTHGGAIPIERQPLDIEPLWEATIRSTALTTLVLHDTSGEPRAVASRITSPSKRTDLLATGVLANDHWLVSLPDEGTLFIVAETNVSTMAKDTLVAVQLLGREWSGLRTYAPTAGPGIAGTARVIGASGRFAGRGGRALERYRIERFARSEGLSQAAAELHLALDAVQTGSEQNDGAPADDAGANDQLMSVEDAAAGAEPLANDTSSER